MSEESSSGVVLVVDDDPENLAMLTEALDLAGYTVLVATDGTSAIARAKLAAPDAILLDAVMPELDGFATCARLKSDEDTRSIPVIFMTGLSESEHIVRAFSVGAIDYVTKPLAPDAVIARIQAHVRTSQLMNRAEDAVELSGRAVLILSDDGSVLWRSSKTSALLEKYELISEQDSTQLAPNLAAWVTQATHALGDVTATAPTFESRREDKRLMVQVAGRTSQGSVVFTLEETEDAVTTSLEERFGLTSREAEVLGWVAAGKTSRDIADILGMSARTVDKHLEHVFVKLGVETRTAAAAIAARFGADTAVKS